MERKAENTNRLFIRDMGWYLLGSLIPMGIGIIKTPVFTRYFTTEEYGYLGLVTITFSYLSILLYSWLASCLWRYYNSYKNRNNLQVLYSNLAVIYLGSTVLLIIATLAWVVFARESLVKNLVLLSFFQFSIKELIGLYLIVVRLEGKAFRYNLIHSLRAITSFALLLGLTFGLEGRIQAMITSVIVVDAGVLLYLAFFGKEGIRFSMSSVSNETLKILFRFGGIGLITNFFFLVMTTSDRYIIAIYADIAAVGIYNTVYNLCQFSLAGLIAVYFNTINPKLNRDLELDSANSGRLIRVFLYPFLLIGLPMVTYLAMYPKEIAWILLGEEFRPGYVIMPWIFSGAYLYGIYMFMEVRYKFADQLKAIVFGVGLASLLNITLNFVFVPVYGYTWAAISTAVANAVLVIFFYSRDSAEIFGNREFLAGVVRAILILSIQVVADVFMRRFFSFNLGYTVAEVTIFTFIYLIVMRKELTNLKISLS